MIRKYESCPDSLFFLFIKRSKKNKNKNKNTPKTFLPTKISNNSGCSMTRIEAISNTKKNKPIKMACIGLVFLKKNGNHSEFFIHLQRKYIYNDCKQYF